MVSGSVVFQARIRDETREGSAPKRECLVSFLPVSAFSHSTTVDALYKRSWLAAVAARSA